MRTRSYRWSARAAVARPRCLRIVQGLVRLDRGTSGSTATPWRAPAGPRHRLPAAGTCFPGATPAQRGVRTGAETGRQERTHGEARDALGLVGLGDYERYYPKQLSGGMQQRVGLARALVVEPEILLMDEPFSALDAQTRKELQVELLDLHAKTRKTIMFVTHDLDEAIYLSDRVLVLLPHPGRVKATLPVPFAAPAGRAAAAARRTGVPENACRDVGPHPRTVRASGLPQSEQAVRHPAARSGVAVPPMPSLRTSRRTSRRPARSATQPSRRNAGASFGSSIGGRRARLLGGVWSPDRAAVHVLPDGDRRTSAFDMIRSGELPRRLSRQPGSCYSAL